MFQSKKTKSAIALILAVIIVAAAFFWLYGRKDNKSGDPSAEFSQLTRDQVMNDFTDRERKNESLDGITQGVIDMYQPRIDKSLKAIKDNKPSSGQETLVSDYLNVAFNYTVLGDYAKAEEWYQKTLEKFPNDYRANMNLGDLYILMGLPKQAAGKFYDTLKLYPKDAMIYAKLAELYYKYADEGKNRAELVFDAGVKNSDSPKNVLNAYIIYLEGYKRDQAKLDDVLREYEKITGSKLEQQKEGIQQNINLD